MHDFLLAKEIIEEVSAITEEKKLDAVKSVDIEIGTIALAHDGLPEHAEDVSLENLEFGLQTISKNTILENTKFNLKKVEGGDWKLTNINI